MATCPYCLETIVEKSSDHIFPEFLGGRRTISCCRTCNSRFGHTFEASAAKHLQPLHVFISSWGLPLRADDPTWRKAYTFEGKPLDLQVGETGVKVIPSNPVIVRDEHGRIISAEVRTRAEAERFINNMRRKGKAREFRIKEVPAPATDLSGLELEFTMGPEVRRLALKISLGALSILGHVPPAVLVEAAHALRDDPAKKIACVLLDYRAHQPLDILRPPLSHMVYVECASDRIYAVVQFFGSWQIFCRINGEAGADPPAAYVGWADPVTGNEEFKTAQPLRISEPPLRTLLTDMPRLISGVASKLAAEAVKRGATNPPNLVVPSIEIS